MPTLLTHATTAPVESDWSVVCLCAAWCRTCDTYRSDLAELAARHPDMRFVWLDVEDDEDWLGDLDIETFPTLLVLARQSTVFFGALPPQIAVLDRTLRALRQGEARAAALQAQEADAARAIGARLMRWRG